ncbi:MAG: efflux RND transporter periplasmic adaptor subunit [Pseudomonadota bacterium]
MISPQSKTSYALRLLLTLYLSGTAATAWAQDSRRAPVRVVIAEESPVRQALALSGTVIAARAASLSPATEGLVARLKVDVGDTVEAGDPLLLLDDELARLQVESDRAAQTRARAALRDSKRRLEEAEELIENNTIAESAVRVLKTETLEDGAELTRMEAMARLSAATLERHTLRAPFSGVVSARNTDIGEWIAPGDTVFGLVSLDELYVDMQVSESYLDSIRQGMPVVVELTGSSEQAFEGIVSKVVPVTDPTARTFLVRVAPSSKNATMRPGMSANASLALDSGYSRVTVPRDAILRFADGRSIAWVVSTVDGINRADERLVQTGLSFEGRVEIVSGIEVGERVVVAGNESLRDDQIVSIVGEDA